MNGRVGLKLQLDVADIERRHFAQTRQSPSTGHSTLCAQPYRHTGSRCVTQLPEPGGFQTWIKVSPAAVLGPSCERPSCIPGGPLRDFARRLVQKLKLTALLASAQSRGPQR